VNVFIIIRMMEGYSFVGFGWFYIAHILFIMPLYVLFNLFFIVFKHLQTFITIHVSNHFILSIILLIVVDHYAVYIYTLLFLFDLLILLFFLRSKRYGFFRERDTDSWSGSWNSRSKYVRFGSILPENQGISPLTGGNTWRNTMGKVLPC